MKTLNCTIIQRAYIAAVYTLAMSCSSNSVHQSEVSVTTTMAKEQLQQIECSQLELPAQISIKKLAAHSQYQMQVVDKKQKTLAYIQQTGEARASFEIYNTRNELVLVGQKKNYSWGAVIELYNCNKNKIGTIKQDVEKSFLSSDASYSVLDEQNNFVFLAEKKNEESKIISVLDSNQAEVAALLVERTEEKFSATLQPAVNQQGGLLMLATLKIYADTGK